MDYRDQTFLRKKAEVEADLLAKDPNVIYEDTIVKYTINLPLSLYAKITKASRTPRGGHRIHRSELVREILENALARETPVNFTRLVALSGQKPPAPQQTKERIRFDYACFWARIRGRLSRRRPTFPDPPKRFHGFIEGIQDPSKFINWKRQKEKALDSARR